MFQGRYGNDQLNKVLFIGGLGINLISLFIPYGYVRSVISGLGMACYVLALYRMFSRKLEVRASENRRFVMWWSKVSSRYQNRKNSGGRARVVRNRPTFEERRQYKYFVCNQCAQRMRVPRGKGKVRVTCTRCGNKFEMKS